MTARRSPNWPPPSARSATRRPADGAAGAPGRARHPRGDVVPARRSPSHRGLRRRVRHRLRQRPGLPRGRRRAARDDARVSSSGRGGAVRPVTRWRPVDLRIDHVYLVSCKYLSRNIANPSPARLFDGLLATAGDWDQTDWYEVDGARRATGPSTTRAGRRRASTDLPDDPATLTPSRPAAPPTGVARTVVSARGAPGHYRALCTRVSTDSAQRWHDNVVRQRSAERQAWRLLRIGNATYFLLGADAPPLAAPAGGEPLGLAPGLSSSWISTSGPPPSGQPQVDWAVTYANVRRHAHAIGAGARRGALEPRPFRPATRGEDLPRHRHRRAPRILPARAPGPTSPVSGIDRSVGPKGFRTDVTRARQASTWRRPSRARPRVSSSAYSRSPPTGSPLAIRVTDDGRAV